MDYYAAWFTIGKNRLGVLLLSLLLLIAQMPAGAFLHNLSANSKDALTIDEARQYMLELINRDRVSQGLTPVQVDTIANIAAQEHSDDMAEWGYISHWDLQGRKPNQRYCEYRGRGAVFENIYTNKNIPFANRKGSLVANQLFSRHEIEQAEECFDNSAGHRQNIMEPHHNLVGIGLSLGDGGRYGQRLTVAQEFVNQSGEFGDLPMALTSGQQSSVTGHLEKGLSLHGIQITRESLPEPMSPDELKQTGSYGMASNSVANYFPGYSHSPSRVNVNKTPNGEQFSVTIKADRNWQDGLYYIIVWVKDPNTNQPFIGSARTMKITNTAMGVIGTIAHHIDAAAVTPRT